MTIVPPSPPRIIYWASLLLIIPSLLTLIPFWLMGKILAHKAGKATGVKPKKWLFLTICFFLGVVVYLAVADLARIGFRYYLVEKGWQIYPYDQLIKSISARMVIILLGFPLLAGVWYKATEKAENKTQETSEVLTRKYFLNLEAFVLGAITVVSLGVCLYHFFNWVLGVSEMEWSDLSAALGYGGTALGFLIVKLWGLVREG